MATQARIEVNGTPGSNDNLPINTLVQLSNQDLGGETTYLWSILDQPLGTTDALSATNIENPTFTPKKEGSYLLQLIVNFGLPDEQINRAIVAVRQVKTLERIPAAGETNESDTMRGWATAVGSLYQRIDALLSDPGIIVGANTSGSTLTRGDVVRVTSGQVIKAGLPGQETVPGFVKAPASTLGNLDELLCVVEGDVAGNASVSAGALTKVRYIGRLANMTLGTGAVGDPIYVSDTATISTTPGTFRRQVGSIMSVSGGLRDFWFDGVGGADITPIDRAYMLYGAPSSGMLNAHRIDGLNATPGGKLGVPYTFRAGDLSTVALVAQRFFASSQDIFQVHTETSVVLARFTSLGNLDMTSKKVQRAIFQAQDATTVPLFARRFSAGATADLFQAQDEAGTALASFLSTGDLDMLSKKIQNGIFQANSTSTPPLITKRFNAGSTADQVQVQDETGAVLLRVAADGTLRMTAQVIDMVSHRINDLLDPAAAQDAATKNYVDTLAENTRLLSNKVDNSAFLLKQHVGIEPIVIPTVRGFPRVDRWGLWRTNGADTGAGVNTAGTYTDPDLGEIFVVCPTAAPDTIWITQELCREDGVPQGCSGKPLILTFQAKRNTAGSPTSITARVVSTTTVGPGTATPDYATGNQVDAAATFVFPPVSAYATYSLTVPALRAGVTAVSVQFSFTFAATSAVAYGYIRRVMLVAGAVAPAWQMRHGSVGGEIVNAERFFQTTWSNGGSNWPYNSGIGNITVANGGDWAIAQVRFRTRMRGTAPNVTVQTPAFVLGSIDVTGTARVTSIARSNDMGFDVANNTGIVVSPTAPWTVRFFWEASAEY